MMNEPGDRQREVGPKHSPGPAAEGPESPGRPTWELVEEPEAATSPPGDPDTARGDTLDRLGTIGTPGRSVPQPAPAEGGRLGRRYELEEVLGAGGMGEVWRARDHRLNRPVAIKRLKRELSHQPDLVTRFLREAQSVAALNHPNIVQVHDFGDDPHGPYLVMELVEGESLADRLRRTGPLDPTSAIALINPVCRALSLAHEKKIIHRDIKPGNILLTAQGIPKLGDFGLARLETADYAQTQTGMLLGTLDFMAPEQRIDPRRADTRSDQWSLAATLYQMLTGQTPRIIYTNRIPGPLAPILLKAFEEDPQQRYQTVEEFRVALVTAAGSAGAEPGAQAPATGVPSAPSTIGPMAAPATVVPQAARAEPKPAIRVPPPAAPARPAPLATRRPPTAAPLKPRRRSKKLLVVLLLLLIAAGGVGLYYGLIAVLGGDKSKGPGRGGGPVFGLEYVPPDSFGAVLVRPARLIEASRTADLARGEPFDEMRQEAGFGPEDVNQVLLAVGPAGPSNGNVPAEFGFVLRFNHPVDAATMFERWCGKRLERESFRGTTFYTNGRDMGGFQADSQTLIIGYPWFARRMLTAGGSGPLVDRLRQADDGSHVIGVFLVDRARYLFRDGLAELQEEFRRDFPEHSGGFLEIPELVQSATLTARAFEAVEAELTLETRDEASAIELEQLTDEGISTLTSLFYDEVAPEMERARVPSVRALRDLVEEMLGSLTVSRSGSRVILRAGG